MRIKLNGAVESPSYGADEIRVESASARAKRSSAGGESARAVAKVYRLGGRARVYVDINAEGGFSFDLERAEAIAFARAVLSKFDVSLED